MKIVRLEIEDDSILSGLDAMALVESPAIEDGFFAFSSEKFAETYTDYPQAAVDAAVQGIKRNEETGNKCATQVGKVRAQQLANREPVSLDTVRRMRSFLLRQRDNYELATSRKDYTACGYISYLLWGGPAALPWAEKTLRQAGEEFAEIGPRGGVKESPKAPKSDTPNPDPKGEGTAKGSASSSRGAEVDAKTEESLQKKADEFNEKYKDKLGYGANVGALKSVYQRGLGAYNTSRSPSVAAAGGAKQWAMARVNAFLFLIKNDRPQNRNYTQDNDLLPKGHPKRKEFKQILESIIAQKMVEQMMFALDVPHYTKDGKLYEGPTHRQGDRLMTGAIHTDESEFLYHIEELSLDVSGLPNFLNEPTGELLVNKEASYGFAAVEDQQILVGPAMVPGKLIPRRDENGDTYFVYFTKDTIKKIAYKAMKDKVIDRVNIEHESGKFVDDVYLIESWIVVNPETDKSREYGLYPTEGTWMVMYKVDNLDVWQGYVVPGLIRGFSIEGYFTEELIK
jgi:hypothetical protein